MFKVGDVVCGSPKGFAHRNGARGTVIEVQPEGGFWVQWHSKVSGGVVMDQEMKAFARAEEILFLRKSKSTGISAFIKRVEEEYPYAKSV